MLRSIFFASGLFVALWGVSLLFIDQLVLADLKETKQNAEDVVEQTKNSAQDLANSAQRRMPQGQPNSGFGQARQVAQQNNGQRPEGFRGYYNTSAQANAEPGDSTANLEQPKKKDAKKSRIVDPPDWAAFSLMSIGAVTMLYSIALPKKKG